MTVETTGFTLVDWQERAVDAWLRGIDSSGGQGTIEVVTGGGKTLIALTCAARLSHSVPDLKIAVVVPTQALAHQWVDAITSYTTISPDQVGLLGGGGRDTLAAKSALVAVLNTASKRLPEMTRDEHAVLLIVDEAHRAGAPKFSAVLSAPSLYRLGLSATPEREEVDDDGEPLVFDEQIVGRKLGPVVYRFGLREARDADWLPKFTLDHHAVSLLPEERGRYDAVSRQVDDAQEELRGLGGEPSRARSLARRHDDLGAAAQRWVALTSQRKDLLYHARERHRVAVELVKRRFEERVSANAPRIILFHERTAEAAALRDDLAEKLPGVRVALEHSSLPQRARRAALADFASGAAPILVSVKALIEGIDVPAADTGVSVASTASVRQRVQSLGRVLRRATDGSRKSAAMHLIYVDDSVDDLIYGRADWSDMTGESANSFWRWPAGASAPEPLLGPPRRPLPTEDDAWAEVQYTSLPAVWPGEVTGQEYTVDTTGVVHNSFHRLIANPQSVGDWIRAFRGRPGGRFRVTPQHRLVLVWESRGERPTPWVLGQLPEPFEVADEVVLDHLVPLRTKRDATSHNTLTVASQAAHVPSPKELRRGAPYTGPSDKMHGTFRLSKKGGGLIERSVRGGRDFAKDDTDTRLARNAHEVLTAWRELGMTITRFYVNQLDHAWYEAEGERRFLAVVPGGFEWPSDEGEKT